MLLCSRYDRQQRGKKKIRLHTNLSSSGSGKAEMKPRSLGTNCFAPKPRPRPGGPDMSEVSEHGLQVNSGENTVWEPPPSSHATAQARLHPSRAED